MSMVAIAAVLVGLVGMIRDEFERFGLMTVMAKLWNRLCEEGLVFRSVLLVAYEALSRRYGAMLPSFEFGVFLVASIAQLWGRGYWLAGRIADLLAVACDAVLERFVAAPGRFRSLLGRVRAAG